VTRRTASARRRVWVLTGLVASVLLACSSDVDSQQTPAAGSDPAGSDLRAAVAAFEGYNRALVERDYSIVAELSAPTFEEWWLVARRTSELVRVGENTGELEGRSQQTVNRVCGVVLLFLGVRVASMSR
jgi:hypothetical protein